MTIECHETKLLDTLFGKETRNLLRVVDTGLSSPRTILCPDGTMRCDWTFQSKGNPLRICECQISPQIEQEISRGPCHSLPIEQYALDCIIESGELTAVCGKQ